MASSTKCEGIVYVADMDNVPIQVFDSQGRFLRKWGTEGTGDGQFIYPDALALDREGNVYVTDGNGRVQVFDSQGRFLRKWGGTPVENNGTFDLHAEAKDGEFLSPEALALDGEGNVYVADSVSYLRPNHRIQVSKPVISNPVG